AARLSIAGLTAQTWYLFSEAKLQTDLAERNLQTRISTLKKVENRYQKGIAQSRDLRLARSESESRRADLILRQQTLKESARNLEIIIGRYPSANILPNDLPNLPPGPEIGSPNYVLSNRPDIVSAEAQLEAAGLEVTATRLAFLPSLSLTAQWSTLERNWSDAFDPDRLAGSIIGSLTQSIFQGGRRIAQTQISEQQMKIVLENYAKTLLNAAKEVEDSLYSEEILLERESALSNAFNEAKAAEKLTFDQYNRGIATIFELLDAQSRRLSSESLLINSRLLRITNRIKLHLAISSPLFEENKY
ncbi:MAG: TolC family protein, partial [Pseudomonadota bacterium]|nr:TolC family protein [Pseudomonadota bacterium]